MSPLPVERAVRTTPEGLMWEPSGRWVRGRKGDVTVVDSRHPVLVWEPGLPVPAYAFPREEVREDLLRPAKNPPTGRHTGSQVFYDLEVDRELLGNAAWTFPADDLAGHISFEWFRRTGRGLDHWYEEEEEIFVHPRDPHKRVDALAGSRHVQVEIAGTVVADTRRPVLLFETGLPTRYYIPPEDIRLDLFGPTGHSTSCPYKGTARYWSWRGEADVPPNIVWSYPEPLPAVAAVEGLLAFFDEAVDITVDGERLRRPLTPFSALFTREAVPPAEPADVVRDAFRHYRAQDRDAALALYADDFTFTSPRDDHIGKDVFFERCFPTASRMTEQRLLRVVPADDETVFVLYEYELTTGARHRNTEAITVRDGLIREVQVFFGGSYDSPA